MSIRRAPIAAVAALLLVASGCGASGGSARSTPSSSATASDPPTSTPSATPDPSTSASPTSGTGVSAQHPGRLEVVPADQASVPAGGCAAQPKAGLVCGADKKQGYRFQPDRVKTLRVVNAEAVSQPQTGLTVRFDASGTKQLASITRTALRTRQLVLLMIPGSRKVLAAPSVASPITGGEVQISGLAGRAAAERIVRQITLTAR